MMPPETRLSKDFHRHPGRAAALSAGWVRRGRGAPVWAAALLLPALLLGACESTDPEARLDTYVADAARAAEQKRDFTAAASFYTDLQRSRPDDPQATLGLARNLRYAGRNEEAARVAAEGLSRFGPHLPLLLEKGKAELAGNRAEMAAQTLQTAPADAGADWELPATLAVAFDRLGRFDMAAEHYRQALAIFPENPDILNNYALSRALAGRLAEAIVLLREAAKSPSARPQVRENLLFLEQLQRSNKALPPNTLLPLKTTEPRRMP